MSHVTHVNASCHTRKTLEYQVKSQKREHILNLARKAAAYKREEITWQDLVVTMVSSGVLQCVAVWCSVLQCVAASCSVLQHVAVAAAYEREEIIWQDLVVTMVLSGL